MSVVCTQRFIPDPNALLTAGTQFLDPGVALVFQPGAAIILDEGTYNATGTYVLFDYSAAGASFPGGQAQLDANLTVTLLSVTNLSQIGAVTDQPGSKRIVVTLNSNPTNGKQFVDADVDFGAGMTILLNALLYATPGTYELYAITGTVANVASITCIPLKSGLTAGVPFLVPGSPNLVKVTLT